MKSDWETIGPLLHGTARAWRLKLDDRLKPMGLSQAKWRTLLHLSIASDALTQAEIAARLGVEEPSVVTLLHRLEREGWVTRQSSPRDRRCKIVHLGQRAQRVITPIKTQMNQTRVSNQSIPWWAYLLFILLASFVLYRIFQQRASEAKAAQPPVRPVLVAKVITKDVPLYLDEIGTCAAYETVQVQAQVSGQIVARNFQDGADVKTGDLLFTIDPRPYQAALEQAQGQLAQAQSKLVLDQITLKRQQELRARNVISPQDLDAAQATVKSDEAMVKTAEGAVAAAQVNLDYCSIRSPIN